MDIAAAGRRRLVSLAIAGVVILQACSDADLERDLRPFYEQTLRWAPCPSDTAPDAECAALRVPADYADPRGAVWTIALARLPATGGAARLGSLVTNPGGPGNSGVSDLRVNGARYDRLRDGYDVVSFDPRGIGASEPAIDCLDAELAAAINDQVSDPATPEQQALAVALAGAIAASCEEQMGEGLALVGTRDVARDMDVLRAVLGEERLDYLGRSYGTYLGALYAELFPGRTERLVLDSAMSPANDYETLRREQAVAFQASIDRFVADCPAHPGCPLAADPGEGGAQLAALIATLDAEPYVAPDGRTLSGSRALHLVESSMYQPETGWPALRVTLAAALAGDLQPMLEAAYGRGLRVDPADAPYLSVVCRDLQRGRDPAVVPDLARAWAADAPLNGANRAWSVLPCTLWPARSDVAPGPLRAAGSGEILVIGVTGDPATPVAWAHALAAMLAHGRLLEWQGDGHVAYGRGSACVAAAVEGFLLDGVLPPDGTICPP